MTSLNKPMYRTGAFPWAVLTVLALSSLAVPAQETVANEPTIEEPHERTDSAELTRREDAAPEETRRGTGSDPTGIYVSQMETCDTLVNDFLTTYGIPGATIALAKDGKLVYLRGFGTADVGATELTQPYHLFRIASISKPITAIAIMTLVESGQLSLADRVFGVGGLLENHPYLSLADVTDPRIGGIRVRQLLEHAGGWDRSVDCYPDPTTPYPWFFTGCDPIVAPLHITHTLGEPNPVTGEAMIRFLMEKGLNFMPNTAYAYSNIGFSVLGEVIETISGMDYEQYVKSNVLAPLGICDMHLGNSLLADKLEREGEYVGNGYLTYSCFGTGQLVPWEYGGFPMEAMGSHGAWISTARDLTRVLVAVDGFATKPDLLTPASIETMTTPSPNNPNYALGWSVNSLDNWWHYGSLDGTQSYFARTWDGYTWAIILNKREGGSFRADLDDLPFECIASVGAFPTHDLMVVPTANSSGMTLSDHTQDSVTVSWAPGNGDQRILVGSEGQPVAAFPLDGTTYAPSSVWGLGSDVGDGTYVLSAGESNSAAITGLSPNVPYHFRVFEYNKNAVTGDHPLYMLCNGEATSVSLPAAPGAVENTLVVDRSTVTPGDLTLAWGASCSDGSEDYGIYEGLISDWSSHTAVDCLDGGDRTEEITPQPGSRYYLVVPHNGNNEGSYGRTSSNAERSQGSPDACRPFQEITDCP